MDNDSAPLYKKIQDYVFAFSDKIGKGNFSNVFKALHEPSQKYVAIKVVQFSSLHTPVLQQLLKSETSILKKIDHPNLIKCEQILSSARNCYIITELCKEGNLEEKLKTNGPYKETELFSIIQDVYKGLKYLVSHNIVHRDIKVSNILINKGVHKIGDFGFAKVSKYLVNIFRFDFKDISIGSPIYMSPEGYVDNIYGSKTDVWSFGILIIELLTGKPPFYLCQNENELKEHLLTEINIEKLCPSISRELKDLLERCLKLDKKKRISVEEIERSQWMMMHSQKMRFSAREVREIREKQKTKTFNEIKERVKSPEDIRFTSQENRPFEEKKSTELFKKTVKLNNEKQKEKQSKKLDSILQQIKHKTHVFQAKLKKEDLRPGSPPLPERKIKQWYDQMSMNKNSSKIIKPQICKEQYNESIQSRQKGKSQYPYHSPAKNLWNLLEKNQKCKQYGSDAFNKTIGCKLNRRTKHEIIDLYIKDKENYHKFSSNSIKEQQVKVGERILNKKITFTQAISIIHYSRLSYKYGSLMAEQKNFDIRAKIFFMSWSVQILLQLLSKIQEGEIIYAKEESLIKNLSMNIEEEQKVDEKKKKLKDVTEEYINKYTLKLKGKKEIISLKYALSYIKQHFSTTWNYYRYHKKQLKNSVQFAIYAYLYTISEETNKLGQFCHNKRGTYENRFLEKLLGLKITSFSIELVDNICKSMNGFDKS